MIIIEILPFFELLIKQAAIINHDSTEHAVKLFLVNPMAPFDLAIEPGPSGPYIHMIYSFV